MDPGITFEEAKRLVAKFRDEREWLKYHTPKNLAESIAIEAAELLEVFQWKTEDECLEYAKNEEGKRRVAEELADIVIYALSLADVLEIDLGLAVLEKLEENERKYPVEKFRGRYRVDF